MPSGGGDTRFWDFEQVHSLDGVAGPANLIFILFALSFSPVLPPMPASSNRR